jgi:hypothetical protein
MTAWATIDFIPPPLSREAAAVQAENIAYFSQRHITPGLNPQKPEALANARSGPYAGLESDIE